MVLFINIAVLQGLKRPMFGLIIGLYRQFLAPVSLFLLVTEIFDFGLLGLWCAFFVITWSAALIAFFYTRRILDRVKISTKKRGKEGEAQRM